MKLEISSLSFARRGRRVLHDISFTAQAGEFLSVLGPNGVGKSTLFRCILGILSDYQGRITIDEAEIRTFTQKQLAGRIAYIPQIHRPTFGYTVLDTVLMGATHRLSPFAQPKQAHVKRALEALSLLGIEALGMRNFAQLSGGEQQLVLVARATAQQADILLMDEPTSALDYGNQLRVLGRVRQLAAEGFTVLLSTHNPQHALSFSDRILALSKGEIAALGPAQAVLTPGLMQQLYGVEVAMEKTRLGSVVLPEQRAVGS